MRRFFAIAISTVVVESWRLSLIDTEGSVLQIILASGTCLADPNGLNCRMQTAVSIEVYNVITPRPSISDMAMYHQLGSKRGTALHRCITTLVRRVNFCDGGRAAFVVSDSATKPLTRSHHLHSVTKSEHAERLQLFLARLTTRIGSKW